MSHAPPRERLNRLVELAAEDGVAARRELTAQLTDLLLDWPSAYPESMREPFEALLEKTLADLEPELRTLLAARFAERATMPLPIVNALIFDASPESRAAIFARNVPSAPQLTEVPSPDEATLLNAIRAARSREIAGILAAELQVPLAIAQRILSDGQAQLLAALCRGAGLSRACFSAIAVLSTTPAGADEHYRQLAAYDDVTDASARGLVAFWRAQVAAQRSSEQAA
jgi:hypothetical protein